ncbi:MAG TPA: RidA family protein [Phycisphaeraceae bacterium]|nr:RidA family protein [Phycisphaeraceae bacterium]
MIRNNIYSGSSLERKVGCSRAVEVGGHIFVSGTSPYAYDETTVGVGDFEQQARRCLEFISEALEQAGASLQNVVRTRVYMKDMNEFETMARIHGEFFREVRPATSFIQVSGFVRPEWLVEIEVEAVREP